MVEVEVDSDQVTITIDRSEILACLTEQGIKCLDEENFFDLFKSAAKRSAVWLIDDTCSELVMNDVEGDLLVEADDDA